MRSIVFFLIILGFTSCNKQKVRIEQKPQIKEVNEQLNKKDTINGYEYIFYFKRKRYSYSNNTYCNLDSLEVIKNGKRYLLKLVNKNLIAPDYGLSEGVYTNDDYNFDGINDIMLYPHIENYSVYGNDYRATFYIFNKKLNNLKIK